MDSVVFRETMENVTKHRDIKLVTTKRRKTLLSEPYYHPKKYYKEQLLAIEIENTQILMNKSVYLGLSILELSKILMYDYVKPKYDETVKLCYMDTDSFIVYIKTDDIYKEFAEDVKTISDTSNYKLS